MSTRILLSATALWLILGGSFVAAAEIMMPLHPVEKGIIEQTNAQRAKYGLAPLGIAPELEKSARDQAAWMTNNHIMQHTSKPVAENIAMGQRSTDEAMNAWMNSDGHRANILNPNYHWIGAAAYTAPDGTVFWCQEFLQ